MKKIYLLLMFVAFLMQFFIAQAQDYQISFVGAGAATNIESIEVKNLTQGTSLTLSQGDVLYLKGVATSINNSYLDGAFKTYPNPMTTNCTVEFFAVNEGLCSIDLYDLMGKKILSGHYHLQSGSHSFGIEGVPSGIYSLSIKSDSYFYSTKLVSKSGSAGAERIEYISGKKLSSSLKSTVVENYVEMAYNEGDRLLITAISGNYKTVKSIVPSATYTESFDFYECIDGSGNSYKTVTIGTQTWMAENLKTTKYNDNTDIPLVTSDATWFGLITPAYSWYNNDKVNYGDNGALYNWYAVNTNKLCPAGWHVATEAEWDALVSYVANDGYSGSEGTALKATESWGSKGNGIDAYGFSAVSAGGRFEFYGSLKGFYNEGFNAYWWTSTQVGSGYTWYHGMIDDIKGVENYSEKQKSGYSVRCVKD